MRRILTLFAAAFVALAGLIASGPVANAASTASVSVVHGIPGTPVNVFVNGKDTLPNFQPGTVAGPLQLPPGDYQVKVFPAADTAGTGTPVIEATATVKAGQNVTLVAPSRPMERPRLPHSSTTPHRSLRARPASSCGTPQLRQQSTYALMARSHSKA